MEPCEAVVWGSAGLACLIRSMNTPIDFELLDRYLSGTASPEEARELESLASRDPAVRELLLSLRSPGGNWNTDAALARIKQQMRRPETAAYRWRWPLRIAAMLIVAAGFGALVLSRAVVRVDQESRAAVTHTSAAGERRSVTLADGSTVILAPASSLRVPVSFDRGERAVYLTGEAYLEVAHDATRPFSVRTKQAETRVLGTTFNVRAYPADSVTEVVLVRGRVSVRPAAGGEALLSPGQIAQATRTNAVVASAEDPQIYADWAAGRLSFRSWPLERIAERLERWYGVEITIADRTLAATPVTAFLQSASLDDVLNTLTETVGARYVRDGQLITLQRRN